MKLMDRIGRKPAAVGFGRGRGGAVQVAPAADHVTIGTGGPEAMLPSANPVNAGVMSAADKTKLDQIDLASIAPPPGPSEFETVSQFSGASIEPSVNQVRVAGYATPGDGGAALYVRAASQPAHGGRVQSADGAWWEIAERTVRPEMYGAAGDGVSDDTAAMVAMADHARERGFLDCVLDGSRTYCYTIPQFLNCIPKIRIEGNGAAFKNSGGGDTDQTFAVNYEGLAFNSAFFTQGPGHYLGSSTPAVFGQLIATVATGATSVTTTEGDADVTVGDRVLIYGFDSQSTSSYPPNPKHFEYATVTAVSGPNVTLDRPLSYSYDAEAPETVGSSIYGRGRMLSLCRPEFHEIDSLHLKNLRILSNPAWTAPNSTVERNGRLTVAGCRTALIENVEVEGGCYPSQSESIHFLGGRVEHGTETDKVIDKLRFENWTTRYHALGTGAKTIEFVNCTILETFNASPHDHLLIEGGRIHGAAANTSSTLIGMNHGCKRITIRGGARFQVDEPLRKSVFLQFIKSATVTVVDGQTVDMTRAAYDSSQVSRVIYEGAICYDSDGNPALRVTRMPYEVAGRVRIEGVFLRPLATNDVLYLSGLDEVVIESVQFAGPYGPQVRTFAQSPLTTPLPTRMLDSRRREGVWLVTSDDATPTITPSYLVPGHRVSAARVIIDVLKPYTGADASCGLLFKEYQGAFAWAIVNLKTAGRRVLDVTGVSGAQTGDTLTGLGDTPVRTFQFQGAPGGAVANAGEAAVWTVRIEGNQI